MHVIEQDEVRVCEIQTAREKVYRACPGSPERERLERKLKELEAAIERTRREQHETLEELNARMAPLSVAEKNQIWARVRDLREQCDLALGPHPANVCPDPRIQML